MERSKRPDLSLLVEILESRSVPYAVIGGIALQIHQREPRTTLDIDIAVVSREDLPRDLLLVSGFREASRHEHTDNWVAPGGTPIQITDDPALVDPVLRAVEVQVEALRLRVLGVVDLLREKLRAARDPASRRSKRLQDLADAQSLLEQDPGTREWAHAYRTAVVGRAASLSVRASRARAVARLDSNPGIPMATSSESAASERSTAPNSRRPPRRVAARRQLSFT
jgi:hypothetical protein